MPEENTTPEITPKKMTPEKAMRWLEVAKKVGLGLWWIIKHVVPFLSAIAATRRKDD